MTYHPILRWSCQHCGQSGEVLCDPRDDVDTRWTKVLNDHLDKAEACYPIHLGAGIAISQESGTLPE